MQLLGAVCWMLLHAHRRHALEYQGQHFSKKLLSFFFHLQFRLPSLFLFPLRSLNCLLIFRMFKMVDFSIKITYGRFAILDTDHHVNLAMVKFANIFNEFFIQTIESFLLPIELHLISPRQLDVWFQLLSQPHLF